MFVVDLIGGIGRRARNTGAAGVVAVRMSGAVLRAGASLPRAALGQWWGAFARQIQFTAWDALTLVSVLAVLCGAIIIGEANAQAVRLGLADTIGRIVVAAGVREIAPALTALIVAGRTGTAIAAELASLEANDTWTLVPRSDVPADARILRCKFIVKIKRKADGSIDRYKTRVVAQGFWSVPLATQLACDDSNGKTSWA